ncbi:MAG: methyltransferase type 12, partial [Nitrospirae bacterium]
MTYPQLMQLANAFSESQVLLAANDLDLFTAVGTGGHTAVGIAKRCKADPEGMLLLLNALTGLGLLSRRGTHYHNTPLGRRYLDRRSPTSISNLLWLLGHHWHDWTNL